MAKKQVQTKKITNKRAKFDYNLKDSYLAGLVLTGRETKSLRLGHGHLRGAYVVVKDNELYLLNATITGFLGGKLTESEQVRTRKLLLKKRELDELIEAKKQGKNIIPTEIVTNQKYIKLRISTGTGRKKYDKRELLKKRDQSRDAMNAVKKFTH